MRDHISNAQEINFFLLLRSVLTPPLDSKSFVFLIFIQVTTKLTPECKKGLTMPETSQNGEDDYVSISVLCSLIASEDRRRKWSSLSWNWHLLISYLKLTFRLSLCRAVLQVPGKAMNVALHWLAHLCQPSFHFKSSRIACGKWTDREVWPLVYSFVLLSLLLCLKKALFFSSSRLKEIACSRGLEKVDLTKTGQQGWVMNCTDKSVLIVICEQYGERRP